ATGPTGSSRASSAPSDDAVESAPLIGPQIAGRSVPGKPELGRGSLQLQGGGNRAQPAAEASFDETRVVARLLDWNDGNVSPRNAKHGAVDRRRRCEARARNPARDGELVPRTPLDAEARARPDRTPLHRESPLHDEVRRQQGDARLKQAPQDR